MAKNAALVALDDRTLPRRRRRVVKVIRTVSIVVKVAIVAGVVGGVVVGAVVMAVAKLPVIGIALAATVDLPAGLILLLLLL